MKMFTKKETEEMEFILSQVADREKSFYPEELHGFFFGLALTPEPIMPSEWIPVVFGKDGPLFDESVDHEACIGRLMGIYNRFMNAANLNKLGFPFDYGKLPEVEYELIEGWSFGLFKAMALRPHFWGMSEEYKKMSDDELPAGLITVIQSFGWIAALAFPDKRRETFRNSENLATKSDDEIKQVLIAVLPSCVDTLQKHGRTLRQKVSPNMPPSGFGQQRSGPKVGRNDPCPCGSGKKYKKCCGVN